VELGNLGMPRWQRGLGRLIKSTWQINQIEKQLMIEKSKASSLLKGIILPSRKNLRGELHVIKNLKAIHLNTQTKLKSSEFRSYKLRY
jgi:hypothetical protein